MLIIGEKINSTRKRIKEAIAARDAEYLQNLAVSQVDAGADYLDVNTGAFPSEEVELMEWLVGVVQDVVEVPLAIDSANPAALQAGLKLHRKPSPLINSISLEQAKFDAVLPLVKDYDAKVLALSIDDGGMTKTAEERFGVAGRLIEALCGEGIEPDRIYLDPLIQPVSVQNDFGLVALDVIRRIKQEFAQVNTVCGLSNISFGLPQRRQLNKTFLIMVMAAGLDSAILDPCDNELMSTIEASNALLGRDRFCKEYIKAFR